MLCLHLIRAHKNYHDSVVDVNFHIIKKNYVLCATIHRTWKL